MVAGVDRVMSMGAIISSPVIVGNAIYVGSADGNLYALR
jgi:outer membrane protein assembly factor BamB